MDVSFKTALRVLALCVAAGASVWAAMHLTAAAEQRTLAAVEAELAEAGMDWAAAEADGTLVHLSGTAPDENARFRALSAAGMAVNPRNLRDRIGVVSTDAETAPEFRLEIHRRGARATVFGLIPADGTDRAPVAARLGGGAVPLAVSDLVSVTADAAPEGWAATVDAALLAARTLDHVRVEAHEGRLAVSGLAPDAETAAELETALREAVPVGAVLVLDLETPRLVASPFMMRLDATGAEARFDGCVAATETGRNRILAAARGAGVATEGAADPCPLAIGAPGPDWDRVAADAIGVLATLGTGTVMVSDLTVVLTQGAGADAAAALRAAARLERALPEAYDLVLPGGTETAGTENGDEAVFTATRSPEGTTILRGTVGATQARDVVESFAASRLAGPGLHLSLDTRGAAPEGWAVRVLAGLDAFADIDSGRLRVTPDTVVLRGASGDPQMAAAAAARLSEALGPGAPVTLDIRYDETLDPVAALPTPEECLAEIDAIQSRTKITFGPGSTELDRDAMRIVERIADVLRECGDVELEVTGHTDSQGRAEMNRTLSEARAIAVLEALVAERVLASTLTATGYGETRPVADNDTEDGREANRRIEFRLKYPLQGPPPPDAEGADAAPGVAEAQEDTDGSD